MNKKSIMCGLYCLALWGMPIGASPIPTSAGINTIQVEHERMIQDGFRSGALTLHERGVLVKQQERIKQIEVRFRKNGLQGGERRQLLTLLRWAEKTIKSKLANSERRMSLD